MKKAHRSLWQTLFTLPVLSWALYDFANTIFSSNITTLFFPVYLTESIGKDEALSQIASTFISYTNAIASFFLVILSPLYGTMIDKTGKKKKYLVPFALLSILSTLLMAVFAMTETKTTMFSLPLSLILLLIAYMFAKFFYQSSLVFYDPMLTDIGTSQERPVISGFGVATGYVGTLLGLAIAFPFASHPSNIPLIFLLSGFAYFVFTLPMLFFYKEPKSDSTTNVSFFSGYREIIQTFKDMKQHKAIFLFMIVYFCLNDAVATAITMMSAYANAVLHFPTSQFLILYLVSTLFSIVGSFIFGFIIKQQGSKKAIIYVSLLMLIGILTAAFSIYTWMFYIAGASYGIAMGAMWVATRTLIIELSPPEKQGQFFGLFAFSGKVSAIIGPFVYGTITLIFAHYGTIASRVALGSLAVFVMISLILLPKINHPSKQDSLRNINTSL